MDPVDGGMGRRETTVECNATESALQSSLFSRESDLCSLEIRCNVWEISRA